MREMNVRTEEETRRQLSDLIDQVQEGGEILIERDGRIVAKLCAYRGEGAERLLIADDFDEGPPAAAS